MHGWSSVTRNDSGDRVGTHTYCSSSIRYSLVIRVKVVAPRLVLARIVRLAELNLCFTVSPWREQINQPFTNCILWTEMSSTTRWWWETCICWTIKTIRIQLKIIVFSKMNDVGQWLPTVNVAYLWMLADRCRSTGQCGQHRWRCFRSGDPDSRLYSSHIGHLQIPLDTGNCRRKSW